MRKVTDVEWGISEYDFTRYLFDTFGFEGLKSEDAYIRMWLEQCQERDGTLCAPGHQACPYEEGFGEEGDEEFVFIDDYSDDFINPKRFTKYRKLSKNKPKDTTYWLLSPKSAKSLNTQFVRDTRVQMHPECGYREGERVRLVSEYGSYLFTVHLNEDVRPNCVVVTNNTLGVNFLTPAILSEEGNNACYQEVKVTVESV